MLLLLTRNWPPPRFPAIHSAALALYIITVGIVGGVHVFRLALARRPLLRPLPVSSLAVVMSDIAARSLPLLIFAASLGLTLLAAGERRAPEVAVALIVALPPVLILSHTLMYVLAAGYPSQEDRGHLLLGGILGFAGAGFLISLLIFWSIAGLAFRLSPLLTAATLWPPALGGAWLLALAAARLYEGDAPS